MRRAFRVFCVVVVCAALGVGAYQFIVSHRTAKRVISVIDSGDQKELDRILGAEPELVNTAIPSNGDSLLIYAVEKNDIASVRLFLRHGADPNIHGFSRRTALHVAVQQNKKDIVQALLEGGANIEALGFRHNSRPLHVAASWGLDPLVVLLVQEGAEIDARDDVGETPLMGAVREGCPSTVRLLMSLGADPNIADVLGRTPISEAAEIGDSVMHEAIAEATRTD